MPSAASSRSRSTSARPKGGWICCPRRSTDGLVMGTVTNRLRASGVPALAVAAAFALRASASQGPTAPTSQQPRLSVLPVQGSVSMLAGAGANITLQMGKDGVLLVDSPPAALVPQVLAEIRRLSDKPIRYLVNTSLDAEHIGGNAALVGPAAGRGTGGAPFGTIGNNRPAIVAHENVLNRLSASQ